MKGLVVAALGLFLAFQALSARADDVSLSPQANAAYLAANAKKPGVIVTPSGLQYRIIQSGFGKRPVGTDIATVSYKGMLINGKVFDATEEDLPAQFEVGRLIPGWTEALEMMREGDKWELVIPANLAYGDRGAGSAIGPGQTLVFDLHLISVTTPPPDHSKDDQQNQ